MLGFRFYCSPVLFSKFSLPLPFGCLSIVVMAADRTSPRSQARSEELVLANNLNNYVTEKYCRSRLSFDVSGAD